MLRQTQPRRGDLEKLAKKRVVLEQELAKCREEILGSSILEKTSKKSPVPLCSFTCSYSLASHNVRAQAEDRRMLLLRERQEEAAKIFESRRQEKRQAKLRVCSSRFRFVSHHVSPSPSATLVRHGLSPKFQ